MSSFFALASKVRTWKVRRPWDSVFRASAVYCFADLVVAAGVLAALYVFPPPEKLRIPRRTDPCGVAALSVMSQFDGRWYLDIARRGYFYEPKYPSNVAFFPAYPLVAAAAFRFTGLPIQLVGLLVSHTCLLGVLLLLSAYVRERSGGQGTRLESYTLLAFGLFPTSFFFRMAYSESTFVLLAILAMLGIRRNWRPAVVAILVGAATAARPVGVALVAPLLFWAWRLPGSRWKRLGRLAWLAPLSLWGLLAYMAFQWAAFGQPFAFVQTQSHWQFRPAVDWGEKALALASWEPLWSAYVPSSPGYCGRFAAEVPGWFNLQMANPLFFVGAIALTVVGGVKRWLNWQEVLLVAGLLLIPYVARGYDTCMCSQGRFVAAAFPLYLVLGNLLCRMPILASAFLLAVSSVYMVVYTALFTAGYFTI